MKKYIIYGIILIIFITFLGLFIKYHPFEEEQKLGIRDEMAIRHIAERNDVPIDSLIPLLPSEKRTDPATTLMNLHVPIKNLNLDKEEIKNVIETEHAKGFPMTDVLRYILWSIWIFTAGFILLRSKKNPFNTNNLATYYSYCIWNNSWCCSECNGSFCKSS
jgi:hypothetical protein